MNDRTYFVFPTLVGYRFEPEFLKFRANILPLLEPDHLYTGSKSKLSPLIRAQWIGGHKLLPKQNAVFMVGFLSNGIKNDVHRGSNSAWVAFQHITSKRSLSQMEVIEHLEKTAAVFKSALNAPETCPHFYDAVRKYVTEAAGSVEFSNIAGRIESSIRESPELNKLNFWS